MKVPIRSVADIGQVIQSQRKKQNIRQEDLAAMAGSSHVFLHSVEKGKATVEFGRVLQLLDELGIEMMLEVPDGHHHTSKPGDQ